MLSSVRGGGGAVAETPSIEKGGYGGAAVGYGKFAGGGGRAVAGTPSIEEGGYGGEAEGYGKSAGGGGGAEGDEPWEPHAGVSEPGRGAAVGLFVE